MSLLRLLGAVALTAAAIGLSGCDAMQARNPGGTYSPVNAVPMPPDASVLLQGADVVAYFADGKHLQGQPTFKSVHEGVTLHFASAEHKAAFDQDPQKYLPQFGGFCANGLVYAIPMGGDPGTWQIIDGKLYIFGGPGSRDAFLLDPQANLAHAHSYWASEVRGHHNLWQSLQRMVLRVPHYKSTQALADAVAAAKAGKP